MSAKELLDALERAKVNLWKYLSSEETTYLPLDIFDLREFWWSGDTAADRLKWGMSTKDTGKWECEGVTEVHAVIDRDGLTFVWYRDGDDEHGYDIHWAVFDNEKVCAES